MQSKAVTVEQYLRELPEERRAPIQAVREVIQENIDEGCVEMMLYGMICFVIPHSIYPAGYHCNPKLPVGLVALASQKNYMAIYLMPAYAEGTSGEDWFRREWAATGKKLDMGKCCLRFRKLDDLALDLIGKAIRRSPIDTFLAQYEASIGNSRRSIAKKKAAPRKSGASSKKKAPRPKRPKTSRRPAR